MDRKASDQHPSAVVRITIGSDGRVYCHDVPLELFPILRGLCPDDPEIARRAPMTLGEKSMTLRESPQSP